MNNSKLNKLNNKKKSSTIKNRLKNLISRIKKKQSDPHYIATGMAAGVFIAMTPTIPFHTILALFLATLIKGSKTTAAIGVWFSNPITIPVLYVSSYKIGSILLKKETNFDLNKIHSISDMLDIGIDVTSIMLLGGLILGILPSIIAYFSTKWIVIFIKRKKI